MTEPELTESRCDQSDEAGIEYGGPSIVLIFVEFSLAIERMFVCSEGMRSGGAEQLRTANDALAAEDISGLSQRDAIGELWRERARLDALDDHLDRDGASKKQKKDAEHGRS